MNLRKIHSYFIIFIALVIIMFIVNVNYSNAQPRSSSDLVKEFYNQINKNDYSEARKYISNKLLSLSDENLKVASGIGDKPLEKIIVMREERINELVKVNLRLYFKDDKKGISEVVLAMEGNNWKIVAIKASSESITNQPKGVRGVIQTNERSTTTVIQTFK